MTVLQKRIKKIEPLLKKSLSENDFNKLLIIADKDEPFYKIDNYFRAIILNTEEQKQKQW